MKIKKIHTILYVENQELSTLYYEEILSRKADLLVAGMTEFKIGEQFVLGLMPNSGIEKILQNKTPHPSEGKGIPRCELYFYMDDLEVIYQKIKSLDIEIISPLAARNWGERCFYFSDPDGHIIAFAEKN